MEYLGQTQTDTYVTGPRLGGSNYQTFLPSVANVTSPKAFDTYPAPSPLRRSLTTFPWKAGSYYQTAKINPGGALTRSNPDPLSLRNALTELDSCKVPPVFAAARNALYTRYTPNDWLMSNTSNYCSADTARGAAERLRLDTVRLCRETDDKTKRAQGDVAKRLGERIGDIQFWKTELNDETDEMIAETNALQDAKRVLERALAETANPLHIGKECLYNREKRQGIDLVHDNVEKELIREVDTIKKCQEMMRNTIDRGNVQLSLNRAAQHELEKDSGDKFNAQGLDETCHGLKNTSRGLTYHNGIEKVDRTVSVPETWGKFTNNNLARSQGEKGSSKQMRGEIQSALNNCANEMWNQWNSVNTALAQRIKETTDARNKLQTHLSQVMQEIFDTEKSIELLKKSIQDKQAPMMLAQTRLETRTRRPNVELCRDAVQNRLVSEVSEISETVENLYEKLRQEEATLQHLLNNKNGLECDLAVKNNSLFLDRERCLGMRKTFPMSPRVVSL